MKFPQGKTADKLPSSKDWQEWIDFKLASWAQARSPEYSTFIEECLRMNKIDGTKYAKFQKYDSDLLYELNNMLDATTTNYIPRKHRRCGIAILLCLNGAVKEESAEMTAGLHKRFTEPMPCEKKEDLFLALTSAVMHNIAPTSPDVLPQEFLVDWVRVWRWTRT